MAGLYQNVDQEIPQSVGDSISLPEQRGELIFGNLVNPRTNTAIPDGLLALSFPGEEFMLRFARTNTAGNFYTYIREPYRPEEVIIQTPETDSIWAPVIGKPADLDLEYLDFAGYTLQKTDSSAIVERSIDNQIENFYFEKKPDSLINNYAHDPFDGAIPVVFRLDDYTRFATLGETMEEVVRFAGFRTKTGGKKYVRVAQDYKDLNTPFVTEPALVFIDGVFIPDHSMLPEFDARAIEQIKIIRDPFSFGSLIYQGMVAIETIEGNFYEKYSGDGIYKTSVARPTRVKQYYRQRYSPTNDGFKRIPDRRHLLLWEPGIELETNNREVLFYTSDVPGVYEVVLDGFTSYGKPLHIRTTFEVHPQPD